MSLSVGQGIKDQMAANGDQPLEDSSFKANGDGTVVEKCLGVKGLYVSSNATGEWINAGPLPTAG